MTKVITIVELAWDVVGGLQVFWHGQTKWYISKRTKRDEPRGDEGQIGWKKNWVPIPGDTRVVFR